MPELDDALIATAPIGDHNGIDGIERRRPETSEHGSRRVR
jgi:hypothetical protein